MDIAVWTALGKRRRLEDSLRRAIRRGASRRMLEEVCIHLSLLLGFPTMLDALETLYRISGPRRPARTSPPRRSGGRAVLRRIYGSQAEKLLRNVRKLHPDMARWLVRDVYGRVFVRPGLSLRDRELLNVAVLALQGLDRQLYSHLRGGLRTGLSPAQLRACLNRVARLSSRSLSGPRKLLTQVVSQSKKSYH